MPIHEKYTTAVKPVSKLLKFLQEQEYIILRFMNNKNAKLFDHSVYQFHCHGLNNSSEFGLKPLHL